jgi:hypothetical protein
VLAFETDDTGAVGFYENQAVPRFTDLVMRRRELTPIRARVAATLDGDVLEVGFGSGLNVPPLSARRHPSPSGRPSDHRPQACSQAGRGQQRAGGVRRP